MAKSFNSKINMWNCSENNLSKGISLVEIILSIALLSFVLALVFEAQWSIGDLLRSNARYLSTSNFANTMVSKRISEPSFDFSSLESGTSTVNGIVSSITTKPFTRCESWIDIHSSWKTDWNTNSTTTSSFLESDLDTAQKYGKDCGGQPSVFNISNFDLIKSVNFESQTTSIDLVGGRAVVSLRPSVSQTNYPTLAVLPVGGSDETLFLNTGSAISGIDVIRGYAFAAQYSSTSQLAIIRIPTNENPDDLTLLATSSLPGVSGARPEGFSIFYFDSKVYIGTKRTAGHEFHIFDVTDPNNPQWLGSKEVNHNINSIAVRDNLVFLATSGNIRDLIVLDVSDPRGIAQVAAIDLAGNEDGRSVAVFRERILLGKHKSLVPGHDEVQYLKYKTSFEGNLLEINPVTSAYVGSDVSSLYFSGGLIFVATSQSAGEFKIFKLMNDSSLNLVVSLNLISNVTGVDTEDNIVGITFGNEVNFFNF